MNKTVLLSTTAAIALMATAASAANGEATTGSHIKRLETVVAKTIAPKPAGRTTTGSRIKRLEDVTVVTDADKTARAGRSAAPADVEALLFEAAAAEGGE